MKYVKLTEAVVSHTRKEKNPIKRGFISVFYKAYYALFKEKAEKQSKYFFVQPDPLSSQYIFNYAEKGLCQTGLKILIPSIEFKKKMYFPRNTVPNITINNIVNEMAKNELNCIHFGEAPSHETHQENPKFNSQIPSLEVLSSTEKDLLSEISTPSPDKISLRLLNWKKLNLEEKNLPISGNGFILHIHGGGFIGMSSRTHQNYTRK